MNRNQIMSVITSLSHSQGLYGRILESINELSEDEREAFLEELEGQNFSDSVDLVMYFEC